MPSGMEMMLKAAGVDLPKIGKDFEDLKTGVVETLNKIDARLKSIDNEQKKLAQRIEELFSWMKKEVEQQPPPPPNQPQLAPSNQAEPPTKPQPPQS